MTIPFTSEKFIEEVATTLDMESQKYDEAIVAMQAKQPILFSYLLSENFKLLTKEEKEYLLYLGLILWKVIENHEVTIPVLTAEEIEEIEEKNWTLFNEAENRNFRTKLDAFFEGYSQEDLLAFIEDALVEDEDSFVTKEGRDLIFIGLKTTIDALCSIQL